MAYEGPLPLAVKQGFSGASTLSGALIGAATAPFTGSSLVQYDTLVGDTSNSISGIAPGTALQTLLSNGSAANATFQYPVGASLVLLSSQTVASVSTLSFTSLISSIYKSYFVSYYNFRPQTDNGTLRVQYSTDNGSTWIVTGYLAGQVRRVYNSSGTNNVNQLININLLPGQGNDAADPPGGGTFYLFNSFNGNIPVQTGLAAGGTNASDALYSIHSGTSSTTTINAIRFIPLIGGSNAGILTGTFNLYGIREF